MAADLNSRSGGEAPCRLLAGDLVEQVPRPALLLFRGAVDLGIGHQLVPQVLSVGGQHLLVLALANRDLFHLAGQRCRHALADLLKAACHAALVEWLVPALGAALQLNIFIRANFLVELVARVQRLQPVEKHLGEVLSKTNDVAAEVQQKAIGLAGFG